MFSYHLHQEERADEERFYEDEIGSTRRTIATKLVVVPPFTIHALLYSENAENQRIERVEKLKLLSLFFFLFGGLFYIVTATWAYILKKNEKFDNESNHSFTLRVMIDSLYGLFYCMNGLVNIWIAMIQSSNAKHILNDVDDNSPFLMSLSTISTGPAMPFLSKGTNTRLIAVTDVEKSYRLSRAVVIGFFVALAGLLDSISYFLEPHRLIEIIVFLIGSILWFLLAIVAVFDISLCHSWIHRNDEEVLAKTHYPTIWYINKVGDISFLIGASIDIVCGIIWLREDYLQLYAWYVDLKLCDHHFSFNKFYFT